MYITNKLYLTNDQKETNLTLYIHFISDLGQNKEEEKVNTCTGKGKFTGREYRNTRKWKMNLL